MDVKIPSSASKCSFWDVRVEDSESEAISLNDEDVKNIVNNKGRIMSVRVSVNGKLGFASSTSESVSELFDRAIKLSKQSDSVFQFSNVHRVADNFSSARLVDPFSVDLKDKVDRIRAINKLTKNVDSVIKTVSGMLKYVKVNSYFLNSSGSEISQDLLRTLFYFNAVGSKGGDLQKFVFRNMKTKGLEMFTKADPVDISSSLVRGVKELLSAKKAPGGKMPVVCDSELTGVFFHEAVGHACEADDLLTDSTVFKNKLGKVIAPEIITFRDGFLNNDGYGFYKYDDEGVRKDMTTLIDRGVLSGYLHSLSTASKLKMEPTGNGRAMDASFNPIPRMSNLVLEPGDSSAEEMIKGVKDGVYACGFTGGEVSPTDGKFVFGASRAYLIKNGEILHPLRDLALSGDILSTLMHINAVGKGREYCRGGHCGKEGQYVPVDEFMPSIRVGEVTVGGE